MNKKIFKRLLWGINGVLTGVIIEKIIHPLSVTTMRSAILIFMVICMIIYFQTKIKE